MNITNLEKAIRLSNQIALTISVKVIKRYLNIETPGYRRWWVRHSRNMQLKLDNLHSPYPTF